MSDNSKRAHDLAVAAAAVVASKEFEKEAVGGTPAERRAAFADYLQEEYEGFLNYYQSKMN